MSTYSFPADARYKYFIYDGEKEAVIAAAERGFTPPEWEEREVVHQFNDGWTIEMLRTPADRSSEVGFLGGCTAGVQWVGYQEKGLVLMSLRSPDGSPHATLLFVRLETAPEKAVDSYGFRTGATPYHNTRVKPESRVVASEGQLYWGQFHSGWFGRDWQQESTQDNRKRVEAWWESLPGQEKDAS